MKDRVLLLGGSGYIGSAFRCLLKKLNVESIAPRRAEIDSTQEGSLRALIQEVRPSFVINAAGFTGKPNVDACETQKDACLEGNAVLPCRIARVCADLRVPWGHVSSGCIYNGEGPIGGFKEEDSPNFSFRSGPCSFYSGSKALGEEMLQGMPDVFIWRLRIPFSHVDSSRNYLSKVMRYERLLDARNSISELSAFVDACWKCWTLRAPYGVYNVVNTGSITTREVTALIEKHLRPQQTFRFFESEQEFMQLAAVAPRSNCVLNNEKIRALGIDLQEVHEAVEQALRTWQE